MVNFENIPVRLHKNTNVATLESTKVPKTIPVNSAETTPSVPHGPVLNELPDHLRDCFIGAPLK